MVVQHNLTAMNSNRMLGITTGTQAKSTEKLSSGYKINRAADDAAGLSISEKMRKQIRGLTQASLNAEDGISAVQTAEGALNEVQDMLQRANELAVKAANGTMSEKDRDYIQDEIDQLMTEIDRVSTTTKFNETYLLKGDGYKTKVGDTDLDVELDGVEYTFAAGTEVKTGDEVKLGTIAVAEELSITASTDADDDDGLDVTNAAIDAAAEEGTYTYDAGGDTYALAANTKLYKATFDGTDFAVTEVTGDAAIKQAYDDINATASKNANYGTKAAATSNGKYFYFTSTATPGADMAGDDIDDLADYAEGAAAHVTKTTVTAGWYDAEDNLVDTITGITGMEAGDTVTVGYAKSFNDEEGNALEVDADSDLAAAVEAAKNGDEIKAYAKVAEDGTVTLSLEKPDPDIALTLSLHVGADSTDDNQISVDIAAMSAKGLGLLNEDGKLLVNGADDTNARNAIDTIAEALQKVSTQRSALGAVQNRLEHTIANLDNVVENTTAAESQIRDTDMATEMVKYSNNNILAQAGQAMLAQANQANQGVLSLLG